MDNLNNSRQTILGHKNCFTKQINFKQILRQIETISKLHTKSPKNMENNDILHKKTRKNLFFDQQNCINLFENNFQTNTITNTNTIQFNFDLTNFRFQNCLPKQIQISEKSKIIWSFNSNTNKYKYKLKHCWSNKF